MSNFPEGWAALSQSLFGAQNGPTKTYSWAQKNVKFVRELCMQFPFCIFRIFNFNKGKYRAGGG